MRARARHVARGRSLARRRHAHRQSGRLSHAHSLLHTPHQMDAQLSIKTLLTAARLLEGGHEVNTLVQPLPTMQDVQATALSPSLTTQPLYAGR